MPYLTRPGTARRAAGTDGPGLGIPGCAHPLVAPAEWAELARPGTPLHWAVLDVDNGPGSRPDPHCLEAAGRLRNARVRALHGAEPQDTVRAAGGRLLGRLDLAHGVRPFAELLADARSFLDWYHVDGFYLDHCPSDRGELPGVRRLTGTLRALLGADGGHLVLGHDTHPFPGYAETGDQLVTFRGAWSDYRWSQVAEWTAAYPPTRFAHFVHGVPRTHLEEAMRVARWQGAATIFFTDRGGAPGPGNRHGQSDPFATLPRYWDEIVSRIGLGISE